MTERPWLKWYPADWRAEPRLRIVSRAARSLWVDIIGLMHEADPYGHLVISGMSPTHKQLAGVLGDSEKDIARLLAELQGAGVFDLGADGTIVSRRMVRDKKKADIAAKNGRGGGSPLLKGWLKPQLNPEDNRQLNQEDNRQLNPEDNRQLKPPDNGGLKPQRPEARGFGPSGQKPMAREPETRVRARVAEAAATPALSEPGWEANSTKWAEFREKLNPNQWLHWFHNARINGSETTLLVLSPFAEEEINKRFSDQLERHFGEPVTVKYAPEEPAKKAKP